MLADTLAQGHTYLADWLFLLAVVVFAVATLGAGLKWPDRTHGALVPLGLTLVALAWLLL
jgi:hypothetical protein